MPLGLGVVPVSFLAARRLLMRSWKVRPQTFLSTPDVQYSKREYSFIADVMLSRAAKAFEPVASKNDVFKQPPSLTTGNGNIEKHLKKASQSSQSIGGFVSLTNNAGPLTSKSADVKNGVKRKSAGYGSLSPSSTSGLSSVFSKQDAFINAPDTIDLTQDSPSIPINFDENDFDDDADIDLDLNYDHITALPKSIPTKTSYEKTTTTQETTFTRPRLPPLFSRQDGLSEPPSSLQTWSSSPPTHKLPPPGALARRQREQYQTQHVDIDVDKPTKKRRTLPWPQNRSEDISQKDLEGPRGSSGSPSGQLCLRCKMPGHQAIACPERFKEMATRQGTLTPQPKDKDVPWNTTASAMKEQQRLFKNKQKMAAKKQTDSDIDVKMSHQPSVAAITLSDEQSRVLNLVVNQGKSVFFTGSAGTGKSVLMRAIITELKKKYIREPDKVAVTASTGLAACNIGGVTLHSFAGIGLGKEDVPSLVRKVRRNANAKNRWIKTKVLIVDEISMVDGDLFDKLEGIARAMKNNGRPFGGIQLVITGDFFQLPPVPDFDRKSQGVKFAFDASTWATSVHHTIGLTEVFRQKDPVFANMLNEMRLGKISDETIRAFRKLNRKLDFNDALEATELFPTRNEVENANAFRMRDLHGKGYRFEARDTGTIKDEALREKLLSNMMAPKVLELKKGAQVMLIKNMDDGLVNGSLGKIVAFMNEKTFEIYDNDPDALNDDINIDDMDESSRQARFKLKSMINKNLVADTGMQYPLVRFATADGTTRDLLVQYEDWKIELPNGEVQAQRSQLPLILAWALSIHKAQGQTLERVKIDLKRVFEKGQAYVALSRATSQEGLEVHNFDKSKVMAHPRVGEFYNSLYSVNKALKHPKIAASKSTAGELEEHKLNIKQGTKFGVSQGRIVMESLGNLQQAKGYDFDDETEALAAYN
ncbi:hypothetical protein B7463_g12002, partial [Scytalidium lignicola]